MQKRILLVLVVIAISNVCFSYQKASSLTDKEIIERLTRLEEGQKALHQQLNMVVNLMYVIIAGIFGLIGFVVWDRKSMAEQVRKQLEESKIRDVILALREYGREHPEFEEVLRRFDLL